MQTGYIFTVNVFRAKEDKLSLLYKQSHVDIESTTLYATFAEISAAIVVVVEFKKFNANNENKLKPFGANTAMRHDKVYN